MVYQQHICQRHFRHLKVLVSRYSTVVNQPSTASIPEKLVNYRDARITEIVDVRTPEEYEEDHIPGSINLPVLKSEERVRIGTLYSSDKFAARKTGAALISKNIAEHIEQYFCKKPQEYSPLIYCWRGGQRSYSMGLILAQIGFQSFVLNGGHKQYRKIVRETMATLPSQFEYRVISGPTGSGKTLLLSAMKDLGLQVLDLEALAKHKGSVLGLWYGETQPTQAFFTSLLLHELQGFSNTEPVWVESESVKVGQVTVPDTLFKCLQLAPRFCIKLPLSERVKHILESYPYWVEDTEALKAILLKLVKCRGHAVVNRWIELVEAEKWEEFVEDMLVNHYDPSYGLSQKKNNLSSTAVQELEIPNLERTTLENVINHIKLL